MPFPVNNIRAACKSQGITLAELERSLKIGNGVIARWEKQKGYPPYDRLIEIASFLNTPVSRLIGKEQETPAAPKNDGQEWVSRLSGLSEQDVELVAQVVEQLRDNPKAMRAALGLALVAVRSSAQAE